MPRVTSRHSVFEHLSGHTIKEPLDARYRACFRPAKYDFVRFLRQDTALGNGMTIAVSAAEVRKK
jgi:hypothetical protein